MTMRSKVSTMGLPVCVCRKLGFLLLVPGVQHLLRLVCEALRIVLRIGAIEFSGVRILQIVRSRRLRTLPAGLSSIQHEDPGAWAAQRKHPVVGVGEDPMPIPVLGCPRVGHELGDLPDILLAAAVFGCPDDVDPEARIVHGRKNSRLSLLRAPQAPAARGAYVHHQAYRSAGGVELGLERLGGAVEGRGVGGRGDQPRRHQAGEQQARHSVHPLFSQNSVTNRFTATAAIQTVALTQSTSRVARPARTPHAAPGRTRHPQYAPRNASTSSRNEPARMYQRQGLNAAARVTPFTPSSVMASGPMQQTPAPALVSAVTALPTTEPRS